MSKASKRRTKPVDLTSRERDIITSALMKHAAELSHAGRMARIFNDKESAKKLGQSSREVSALGFRIGGRSTV